MLKRLFFLLLLSSPCFAQYQPTWESLDKRPIPQWYQDAKFGIFIHWGVYAVPAWTPKGNYSEWYQYWLNTKAYNGAVVDYHQKNYGDLTYYQLVDRFKADRYQPDEWAKLIEQSGAKYVVLTSKHHDGFALWPSKNASDTWGFPWNAVEAGPHRDLLGDLFTAIRKTSVHAGMYYSLYEWFNPLYLTDKPKYVRDHMWPQMKDVITSYQPDVFWTDGEWEGADTLWKSREFLTWMFNESPVKDKVVVNDRWGSGVRFHHGGFYTPEYQPDLDFEDHYWEESRGMGFSYGYNREEDAWDYNSAQVLILSLVDKVSRGGNFLLDIGPDSHGKIPPIMQERLMQIGQWMKINSEAIYGSSRWRSPSQWSEGKRDYKPKNDDWKTGGDIALKLTVDPEPGYAVKECFFTYNASTNTLYALLPKWPSSKTFVIRDLAAGAGASASLLGYNGNISFFQKGKDLVVALPEYDPNTLPDQPVYVIRISNTGAFTKNPIVNISYPKGTVNPSVDLSNRSENAAIHYTLDGADPTESSPLYNNTSFVVDHSATLKARAFLPNRLPSAVQNADLKTYIWNKAASTKKLKPGLNYAAFELKATSVTDLQNTEPVKKDVAESVDLKYGTRQEYIGLRFDGFIKVPDDALYTFYLATDDGSKLWIDGQELIDNDGPHSGEEKTASIALKKGYHQIRLEYFQGAGGSELELKMSQAGQVKTLIPASVLYHK